MSYSLLKIKTMSLKPKNRFEKMDYSKIQNLNQIQAERAKLESKLKKQEKRIDTSFIIAKKHTKDIFSIPIILKNIACRIISIDTLLAHPATLFKVGGLIGRRLFAKKKI